MEESSFEFFYEREEAMAKGDVDAADPQQACGTVTFSPR